MKTSAWVYLLPFYMISVPGKSAAQLSDPQLLPRYSYPIFTVTGHEQHTGTAFFYKSGDTTFLVSNYHAIKGMNPLKQTISFSSDTLYIKFPDACDSARAIVNATARYYYFIKPFAEQGYSGAPVIGKFRYPNNQIEYRFMGVVFAGQPATRQTWAIKGDVALQYLQGL